MAGAFKILKDVAHLYTGKSEGYCEVYKEDGFGLPNRKKWSAEFQGNRQGQNPV